MIGDGILVLGNDGAAFEQCLEPGDPLVRPVGEVQQGTLLDLAGLAIALAQQDGRGRVAIGDGFDIHGNIIAIAPRPSNKNPPDYMATFQCPSKQIRLRYQYLDGTERGKLRLRVQAINFGQWGRGDFVPHWQDEVWLCKTRN